MPEEARDLILTQANDRLGETLEALIIPPEYQEEAKQAATPLLKGEVRYDYENFIDLQTIATPASMVAATQDIQEFSRLRIDRLDGSQKAAERLLKFSLEKIQADELSDIEFNNW